MKTNLSLLALAAFVAGSISAAVAASDSGKTVQITANDTLRYDVTHIEVSPGEKLHIVLHNAGTVPKEVMGHNWVLLTSDENPDAYLAAAMTAKATNYQPAELKNKVLAAVSLLGPGQTGEVEFTAPTRPGTYVYLCSFPAHCAAGMRGVLVVR